MRGNITRRGKTSWRLKFDVGVDAAGNRLIEYETVRGTKKDAQETLARRLAEIADGKIVRRTSETLADYARMWATAIAPARTSGKTLERYKQIIEIHIAPHLGAIALKALDGPTIDRFYTHCRTAGRRDGGGGLAQQTVHHIHRLLSQILSSAVKAKKLRQSPILDVQTTPKARKADIQVLDDQELAALFRYLEGRPLYMPVLLTASTGMRRGEVLAVRWSDIDLDRAELRVAQVAELVARKV
jgi:integrase